MSGRTDLIPKPAHRHIGTARASLRDGVAQNMSHAFQDYFATAAASSNLTESSFETPSPLMVTP